MNNPVIIEERQKLNTPHLSSEIFPLVVVHIQETGLKEHAEPLIHWLYRSGRCAVLVVVREDQIELFRENSILPLEKSEKLQLKTEREFLNSHFDPEIILTFHPETPSIISKKYDLPGTIRIVMQHGLSDKTAFFHEASGIKDPLEPYDAVFLAGPIFLEGTLARYKKANPETFNRLEFFEIGSPKTDSLFRSLISRELLLEEMGLDKMKPVVTYAPTFEKEASLVINGEKIIESLAELNVNLIIKLHHISLKSPVSEPWVIHETGGKDWRRIIENLEKKFPNIRLAQKYDANPYLSATDVLVSDVSGVAYEYLLLNRPVVFYDVPEIFNIYGKEGIHYWGRQSGEVATNISELKYYVERSLEKPEEKKAARESIIKRIAYNSGKAAEAAGMSILDMAEKMLEMKK